MIYLVQAVLFLLPVVLNAYFPITSNGILPVAWGVILAYGATIEIPKWLRAFRSRRDARLEAQKRVRQGTDSAPLD
jgi:hypothetical protein